MMFLCVFGVSAFEPCSLRFCLICLFRLDRLRSAGSHASDLDLPCLCLLTLRQTDAKDAVLKIGRCSFRCHALRQRERTGERAIAPLDAVIMVALDLILEFPFAF